MTSSQKNAQAKRVSPVHKKKKIFKIKKAAYSDAVPQMVFVFAHEGKDELAICKALNVTIRTFRKWCDIHTDLKEALVQGWEQSRPELALPDVGRPTIYDSVRHPMLAKSFALLNMIDTQIYEALGIGQTTYYRWQREHPKFRQALLEGKVTADVEVVSALHKKATGFTQTIRKIGKLQKDTGEEIQLVDEQYYPPDTNACKFWLSNRQGHLWGAKTDAEQINDNNFNIVLNMKDADDE